MKWHFRRAKRSCKSYHKHPRSLCKNFDRISIFVISTPDFTQFWLFGELPALVDYFIWPFFSTFFHFAAQFCIFAALKCLRISFITWRQLRSKPLSIYSSRIQSEGIFLEKKQIFTLWEQNSRLGTLKLKHKNKAYLGDFHVIFPSFCALRVSENHFDSSKI